MQDPGENESRERECMSFGVIASDLPAEALAKAEAKQSSFAATRKLDCFVAEPVIGRAFARPVGSSQ
jgi:hypothetical protein